MDIAGNLPIVSILILAIALGPGVVWVIERWLDETVPKIPD